MQVEWELQNSKRASRKKVHERMARELAVLKADQAAGLTYKSGMAVEEPSVSTRKRKTGPPMAERRCKHCGQLGHVQARHRDCLKNPKRLKALEEVHDESLMQVEEHLKEPKWPLEGSDDPKSNPETVASFFDAVLPSSTTAVPGQKKDCQSQTSVATPLWKPTNTFLWEAVLASLAKKIIAPVDT